MSPSYQELFLSIRAGCTTMIWSRGVALARSQSVALNAQDTGKVSLRVSSDTTNVAATVDLFIDDEDWQCTCQSPADPCEHVAAAIIALRQDRSGEAPLPQTGKTVAKLSYHLQSSGHGLHLSRYLISGQDQSEVTFSVSAVASGRTPGPEIIATEDDIAIDLLLERFPNGYVDSQSMPSLLRALTNQTTVQLDGKSINIATTPLGFYVTLMDKGNGYHLAGHQDQRIEKIFANGAALSASHLHPLHLPKLSRVEHEIMQTGKFFHPADEQHLQTVIIPQLRKKRIKVVNKSTKFPDSKLIHPRLDFNLSKTESGVRIQPRIVYGSPITAYLQGRNLIRVGQFLPKRDLFQENELAKELARDYQLELDQTYHFDGLAAVQFMQTAQGMKTPENEGIFCEYAIFPEPTPRIDGSTETFKLTFETDDNSTTRTASARAVLKAWDEKQPLVRLLEGGFAPLPEGFLRQNANLIKELLAAKDEGDKIVNAAKPALAKLYDELDQEMPPALANFRDRVLNFTIKDDYDLPVGINAKLRPYQQEGYQWLCNLKSLGTGGVLADDMGLGKTLQSIAILSGKSLVVAPTSVIYNWQRELTKFRPDLSVSLYHGSHRALDNSADVVLTSYALLRIDRDTFCSIDWETIVLDESHVIKNSTSQVSQTAYRLKGKFKLAMTGTPLENSLDDLWSQFQFINPGFLGSETFFQQHFRKPILKGQAGAVENLQAKIKPFIMRRLKSEVAHDLPEKTITHHLIVLNKEERAVYEALHNTARNDLKEHLSNSSAFTMLTALLRLRQACCHLGLLPGHTPTTSASTKEEFLRDALIEITSQGHKAIVFSQWTGLLDLIEKSLDQRISHLRLDGSTRERSKVVESFQADAGPPVLLMSLKAGGVGLNLTAADHVYFLDPWWNPAIENQAADRAHRIGQTKKVQVHKLIAKDTIEEKVITLQEKKQQLANLATDFVGRDLPLNQDDIRELIN